MTICIDITICMIGVTAVVEEHAVEVVEIHLDVGTGVAAGTLQFSATKRKIACLLLIF